MLTWASPIVKYQWLVAFFQKLKHLAEDLNDVIKLEKKDLLGRIDNQGTDLKKKIELETNEIRFLFQ
jgi:hypothetical protein